MATRNIEIEDLEEYFKEIISKKESIRSLSQKIGVPRNTLARKIRKTYENDSRYEQYRDIINSYQHSGGRIGENKKGFTYACTHNLQPFFEKYCQYKREYMQDKEIIAMRSSMYDAANGNYVNILWEIVSVRSNQENVILHYL